MDYFVTFKDLIIKSSTLNTISETVLYKLLEQVPNLPSVTVMAWSLKPMQKMLWATQEGLRCFYGDGATKNMGMVHKGCIGQGKEELDQCMRVHQMTLDCTLIRQDTKGRKASRGTKQQIRGTLKALLDPVERASAPNFAASVFGPNVWGLIPNLS